MARTIPANVPIAVRSSSTKTSLRSARMQGRGATVTATRSRSRSRGVAAAGHLRRLSASRGPSDLDGLPPDLPSRGHRHGRAGTPERADAPRKPADPPAGRAGRRQRVRCDAGLRPVRSGRARRRDAARCGGHPVDRGVRVSRRPLRVGGRGGASVRPPCGRAGGSRGPVRSGEDNARLSRPPASSVARAGMPLATATSRRRRPSALHPSPNHRLPGGFGTEQGPLDPSDTALHRPVGRRIGNMSSP